MLLLQDPIQEITSIGPVYILSLALNLDRDKSLEGKRGLSSHEAKGGISSRKEIISYHVT